MRTYIDNYEGSKIRCFSSIYRVNIIGRRALVPIFEYTSTNCGNVYATENTKLRKTGEFFEIDGKPTIIKEEPVYYV